MHTQDNACIANDFIRLLLLFSTTLRRPLRPPDGLSAGSRAFEALFILQGHIGENVTMSELARETGMSKQQLAKLIRPLEEAALVRRERDVGNRRRIYAFITPKGERTVDALLKEAVSGIVPEMEAYTPEEKGELTACIAVFRRLLKRLAKPQQDG